MADQRKIIAFKDNQATMLSVCILNVLWKDNPEGRKQK